MEMKYNKLCILGAASGIVGAIFYTRFPFLPPLALTLGILFALLMAYKSRLIKPTQNSENPAPDNAKHHLPPLRQTSRGVYRSARFKSSQFDCAD